MSVKETARQQRLHTTTTPVAYERKCITMASMVPFNRYNTAIDAPVRFYDMLDDFFNFPAPSSSISPSSAMRLSPFSAEMEARIESGPAL